MFGQRDCELTRVRDHSSRSVATLFKLEGDETSSQSRPSSEYGMSSPRSHRSGYTSASDGESERGGGRGEHRRPSTFSRDSEYVAVVSDTQIAKRNTKLDCSAGRGLAPLRRRSRKGSKLRIETSIHDLVQGRRDGCVACMRCVVAQGSPYSLPDGHEETSQTVIVTGTEIGSTEIVIETTEIVTVTVTTEIAESVVAAIGIEIEVAPDRVNATMSTWHVGIGLRAALT